MLTAIQKNFKSHLTYGKEVMISNSVATEILTRKAKTVMAPKASVYVFSCLCK